jgi:hypothetical protein
MRREILLAGLLLAIPIIATPASAFCVRNQTDITLIARLETPNPLGGFHTMIRPGKEVCCDWFNRNCNPSGAREGLLEFRIRDRRKKGPSTMYCDNTPKRRVYGVSNGNITITKATEKRGRLACDSRDFFQRELDPAKYKARKTRMPPPIVVPRIETPDLPPDITPPDTPPNAQTEQTMEQPKP